MESSDEHDNQVLQDARDDLAALFPAPTAHAGPRRQLPVTGVAPDPGSLSALRVAIWSASFKKMMTHYRRRATHAGSDSKYQRITQIMDSMQDERSFELAVEIYFLDRKKKDAQAADLIYGLLQYVQETAENVAEAKDRRNRPSEQGDDKLPDDALAQFPGFVVSTVLRLAMDIACKLGKLQKVQSATPLHVAAADIHELGHKQAVENVMLDHITRALGSQSATYVTATDVWRVLATYVAHRPEAAAL